MTEERVDDIGFGGLRLIQAPDEFCYGVDAVLLAHMAAGFIKGAPRLVVDLGCGDGILPLLLSHKTLAQRIIGVDVRADSLERARRSAALNGLADRLSFLHGDVKDWQAGAGAGCSPGWGAALAGQVDAVVSNPPYVQAQGGLVNERDAKRIARHETTAGLEEFLACGAGLLRDKGEMFMVHRPQRLVDICCLARHHGLEVKTLLPVCPYPAASPNILLLRLVKGGGRQLTMLPALAVRDETGAYTPALQEAYRPGLAGAFQR